MKVLLDSNKNYYKANLHTHSTNSDGNLTPEQIKELYKSHGYSIVAITDHEHVLDNSHLDDENFLTITSCEIAIREFWGKPRPKSWSHMRLVHLNFYALDQHNTITPCYNPDYDHFTNPDIEHLIKYDGIYERSISPEGINDIIKKANEAGFIVAYNHPAWSIENSSHALNYDGFFAIEVYNHSCFVLGVPEYTIGMFDDMVRAGKKIYCTMCDDAHFKAGYGEPNFDALGGWVMVNANTLEYAKIMEALQKGDFYASNGPEIYSLVIDGDKVKVRCSDAVQITYTNHGKKARAVNARKGEFVTEAEFDIDYTDDVWFRITVRDQYGKVAHTQAYNI